jgi:hypothetical protein
MTVRDARRSAARRASAVPGEDVGCVLDVGDDGPYIARHSSLLPDGVSGQRGGLGAYPDPGRTVENGGVDVTSTTLKMPSVVWNTEQQRKARSGADGVPPGAWRAPKGIG